MFATDSRETLINSRSIMLCVFCVVTLFLCMVGTTSSTSLSPASESGDDPLDLLHSPAPMSDKATSSTLMDVCSIDNRLITVGERGYIFYTDDLGMTWRQAQVPVSVTLTAVTFPSPRMGWAVGHDGIILHSLDGGLTWKKQLDGRDINRLMMAQLEPLVAQNENRLAEADEKKREAIERRLENLEFFLDDVKMAVEEGPTRPLMDVWFRNEHEGIAVGVFGILLRTTDGGENWVSLLDRIDNPDGFHYYGICRSGDALFIAGEAGMLFRSDDWGQTWIRLASPYDGTFFGITGSDDGGAVAAMGLRGSLFLSYDGGRTWDRVRHGKKASISAGTFLSDDTLVLVCVDGSILESRDNGRTFAVRAERFPGSTSVAESNDNHIVVAGLRGLIRAARE